MRRKDSSVNSRALSRRLFAVEHQQGGGTKQRSQTRGQKAYLLGSRFVHGRWGVYSTTSRIRSRLAFEITRRGGMDIVSTCNGHQLELRITLFICNLRLAKKTRSKLLKKLQIDGGKRMGGFIELQLAKSVHLKNSAQSALGEWMVLEAVL